MQLPTFTDTKLFDQVFTHRSYLNEADNSAESNERLEFLGDSILSFVVSSHIYLSFPKLAEGELTNLRSALTNTNNLYMVSKGLELGKHLKLSRGEEHSGGRENKTILADTLEALIGGLYLDQGILAAKTFIEETVLKNVEDLITHGLKDPKSTLQEQIQRVHKISPLYKTLREEGPDHAKKYTVGVYLNEELLSQGFGASKQEAEKEAAKHALLELQRLLDTAE